MNRNALVATVLGVVGCGASVHGQTWEPNGAVLRFEVSNGIGWTSSMPAIAGQQIEYRAVLSYTGTRGDLFALGEAIFQPTMSNVGNDTQTLPWLANGALPEADGANPAPLAQYGRVSYGFLATNTINQNVITTFRHNSGSAGAPAGSWIRVAGSFVSQWPRSLAGPVPPLDVTNTDINNILRGIACTQVSQAINPSAHRAGVQNLVLFRGAVTFDPITGGPLMEIGTFMESLRRWGGTTGAAEGDDRRYVAWQTGPGDTGTGPAGHRTGVMIQPAFVVIPAPMGTGILVAGAVIAARRRRG